MRIWFILLVCLGVLLLFAGGCSSANCREDGDCTGGEVCQSGQCTKKEPQTTTCAQSSECKSDEFCKDGRCIAKSSGCQADGECQEGERCQGGLCVKLECSKDEDCAGQTRSFCSDKGFCEWQCKVDNQCALTERCEPQRRVCIRRKELACVKDAECGAGEVCWSYHCWKSCDPKKPQPGGCAGGEYCQVTEHQGSLGICLQACEPGKSGCATGLLCHDHMPCFAQSCPFPEVGPLALPKPHCVPPFFPQKQGTEGVGARCYENRKSGPFCDPHKGLMCAHLNNDGTEDSFGFCLQPCYPGLKEDCPTGYECVSKAIARGLQGWPGVCLPKGSVALGGSCDLVSRRCLPGLYCLEGSVGSGQCRSLGKEGESCGYNVLEESCAAGLACDPLSKTCLKVCDLTKGRENNPACSAGVACVEFTGPWGKGLCYVLRKVGEKCQDSRFCASGLSCVKGACARASSRKEGEKCGSDDPCHPGLACNAQTTVCMAYCDPYKGESNNPMCRTGQWCLPTWNSPLGNIFGGFCWTQGTRKEGETCDSQKLDCAAGLTCLPGAKEVCVKACYPDKGITNNPVCAAGTYCGQPQGALAGSSCLPYPKVLQGPKEKGEACSPAPYDAQKAKWCNGSKKLFCYVASSATSTTELCHKSCDPTKTGECDASESCLEYVQSPSGGVCLPNPTQKVGDSCDGLQSVCLAGLVCRLGSCVKPCFYTQGRENNPVCGAGELCLFHHSSALGGFCVQATQKEGETCSQDKPCLASLFCHNSNCVRACDPGKGTTSNSACATGQECALYLPQFSTPGVSWPTGGGICLPKGSVAQGGICDGLRLRCNAGLYCHTGKCTKQTKQEGDLCQPDACTAGLVCYKPSDDPGTCHKACDPNAASSSCDAGLRCYSSGTAPLGGICAP